jgi:hypothetical protein
VHPDDEQRLEQLFSGMWTVKRALQRDARAAVDAYWEGTARRELDAKAWRRELGLTREGMEHRAYAHMERAGRLGHHVSKALVMHQADEVYETSVARHLFADASGRRHGRPKTGIWWDYTRIPGRAAPARTPKSGHGRRSACTAPSPGTWTPTATPSCPRP